MRATGPLQFGHGCDAVETFESLASLALDARFNSATVVTPWKQRVAGARPRGNQRFNSATVVTPWKHRHADAMRWIIREASIRPRL